MLQICKMAGIHDIGLKLHGSRNVRNAGEARGVQWEPWQRPTNAWRGNAQQDVAWPVLKLVRHAADGNDGNGMLLRAALTLASACPLSCHTHASCGSHAAPMHVSHHLLAMVMPRLPATLHMLLACCLMLGEAALMPPSCRPCASPPCCVWHAASRWGSSPLAPLVPSAMPRPCRRQLTTPPAAPLPPAPRQSSACSRRSTRCGQRRRLRRRQSRRAAWW